MNIDNLDLNLLRVFDAIYREHSLSRAAVRLGMSQPGISQAHNRLRQSLGDPLFVRRSHGVVPTACSEALAAPIRDALEKLHAALQTISTPDIRQADRRLRIAMSDYSESLILAPLTRILEEQAPKLHLRIVPVDNIDLHLALQEGELDLVLGAIPKLTELYRHQVLFKEEFVCIARRGHPHIDGTLDMDTYTACRHIGLAARSSSASRVEEACLAAGFQRQTSIIVPSFLAMPFMVAASDYLATIPRRMLRLVPPQLGLQVLPPPVNIRPANLRQYWPERHHLDAVSCWLRENIYQICQTL